MFFFNLLIVYLTNIAWIDWSQTCTTVDLKNASRTCWDNGIYTKNKHRPVKTKIIEIFQIEKSNSFLTVFSISLKTLRCIKVREILFNTYISSSLTYKLNIATKLSSAKLSGNRRPAFSISLLNLAECIFLHKATSQSGQVSYSVLGRLQSALWYENLLIPSLCRYFISYSTPSITRNDIHNIYCRYYTPMSL